MHYHPCCDVWTTRGSAAKRNSHIKHLKWRKLISTLDKNIEEKKLALQAMMKEKGWRLPAVLNEACEAQSTRTVSEQLPFRLHNPYQPPQDLQASLSPKDFTRSNKNLFTQNSPGTFYLK